MNETTKESKFLDAINQYAEQQKALIGSQVEEYKAQKIEQATEAGLQDAYELIQRNIAERKASIVTEYAQKEYALKRELYAARQRITDEVFAAAEEKLRAYTGTEEYRAAFLRDARRAAGLCGSSACILTVNQRDKALAEEALPLFAEAQIREDGNIAVGGFTALCDEQGVLIDCTLDTKLSAERERFIEYSGLKVVVR